MLVCDTRVHSRENDAVKKDTLADLPPFPHKRLLSVNVPKSKEDASHARTSFVQAFSHWHVNWCSGILISGLDLVSLPSFSQKPQPYCQGSSDIQKSVCLQCIHTRREIFIPFHLNIFLSINPVQVIWLIAERTYIPHIYLISGNSEYTREATLTNCVKKAININLRDIIR